MNFVIFEDQKKCEMESDRKREREGEKETEREKERDREREKNVELGTRILFTLEMKKQRAIGRNYISCER